MSLINDMLKDLERRPKRLLSEDQALMNLQSTLAQEFQQYKRPFIIGLLLTSLLVVLFLVRTEIKHHTRLDAQAVSLVPSMTLKNNATTKDASDIPSSATFLTGIAMQLQQNNTFLRLLLNQNAIYRLSFNTNRNELNLILENTTITAALPKINYAGSGIENITAYTDNAGNLKLVLKLNTHAELKHLELNKEGKAPELQMDIFYNGDDNEHTLVQKSQDTIPVTIKKPVLESRNQQKYEDALALINASQDGEALQLLNRLSTDSPSFKKTYKTLASLLIRQKKTVEAKKVIEKGLQEDPGNPELTELAAHLLVNEGKIDGAIKLLESVNPSMSQNTDYYAMIAALYQQQGKDTLALNLYKQLLGLQPANGKWWVGLGIALEDTGDKAESLEAFSKADSLGGLNPELKAYVESRLQMG